MFSFFGREACGITTWSQGWNPCSHWKLTLDSQGAWIFLFIHAIPSLFLLLFSLFSHQIPAFFMMTRSWGHSSRKINSSPLLFPKPPPPPPPICPILIFLYICTMTKCSIWAGSWERRLQAYMQRGFLSLWLCFFLYDCLSVSTVTWSIFVYSCGAMSNK